MRRSVRSRRRLIRPVISWCRLRFGTDGEVSFERAGGVLMAAIPGGDVGDRWPVTTFTAEAVVRLAGNACPILDLIAEPAGQSILMSPRATTVRTGGVISSPNASAYSMTAFPRLGGIRRQRNERGYSDSAKKILAVGTHGHQAIPRLSDARKAGIAIVNRDLGPDPWQIAL